MTEPQSGDCKNTTLVTKKGKTMSDLELFLLGMLLIGIVYHIVEVVRNNTETSKLKQEIDDLKRELEEMKRKG